MSVPKRFGFLISGLMVCLLTLPVLGQADNGGGGGGGGGGNNGAGGGGGGGGGGGNGGFGRRGNFDPAQVQQRMLDRIKTALGASDDEFEAIQPKVLAVMQDQRDANPRMMNMFGRGGGGGGRFNAGPSTQPSAVTTAMQDLQTTLDDQNATPDEIKAKLDTLRQARAKARQDLVVAQQDLKSVLTQRQEAVMVLMGYLD